MRGASRVFASIHVPYIGDGNKYALTIAQLIIGKMTDRGQYCTAIVANWSENGREPAVNSHTGALWESASQKTDLSLIGNMYDIEFITIYTFTMGVQNVYIMLADYLN